MPDANGSSPGEVDKCQCYAPIGKEKEDKNGSEGAEHVVGETVSQSSVRSEVVDR